MAMTRGTVTVASDGTVTKSGFAGALYDELWTEYTTALANANQPIPTDAIVLASVRKGLASAAKVGSLVIAYIQANGQATITTSQSGLQRWGGVDTEAPSADKFLAIL
jgi:hypothetical protein